MASFETALAKTLVFEGGLVDRADDPGGLTNFGISSASHLELSPDQIRNMTQEQAAAIYRAQYWPDIYDQISDQRIANGLFDFGVTSGPHVAVQTLQGAIFGMGGPACDGAFGPATLAALNRVSGNAILKEFTTERGLFYAQLGKPQFLHSWLARTIDAVL